MSVTKKQLVAGIEMLIAVTDTIRAAKRVPSGVLYTSLIGKMDLDGYNRMIDTLKGTGLVRELNHELIWVEPVKGKAIVRPDSHLKSVWIVSVSGGPSHGHILREGFSTEQGAFRFSESQAAKEVLALLESQAEKGGAK